jgi:hypothetical protein
MAIQLAFLLVSAIENDINTLFRLFDNSRRLSAPPLLGVCYFIIVFGGGLFQERDGLVPTLVIVCDAVPDSGVLIQVGNKVAIDIVRNVELAVNGARGNAP